MLKSHAGDRTSLQSYSTAAKSNVKKRQYKKETVGWDPSQHNIPIEDMKSLKKTSVAV